MFGQVKNILTRDGCRKYKTLDCTLDCIKDEVHLVKEKTRSICEKMDLQNHINAKKALTFIMLNVNLEKVNNELIGNFCQRYSSILPRHTNTKNICTKYCIRSHELSRKPTEQCGQIELL